MMRRTLGAPFGGTTWAGQYGFDWLASRLISPPNFCGGGGRYFPSMVVVALGEPGVPVTCCAEPAVPIKANAHAASSPRPITFFVAFASNVIATSHIRAETQWRAS
jgi:hypothetical protein